MSAPPIPLLFLSDWSLAPSICAGTVAAAGLYLWAGHRAEGWPAWRTGAFLLGLLTILVALDSGLDSFDDELLSVHMAQHILLIDVAPPLLLLGRPTLLALRSLPPRPRRSFGRGLVALRRYATPAACLVIYTVIVLGWHIPACFDAAERSQTLHQTEHACFVLAGLALWWPLIGDPAPSQRLGSLAQIPYLVLAMTPMMVIGVYLDSATTVLYPFYTLPARALGISALADEHQAGGIMWVVGTTIMSWGGLASIRSAMLHAEHRQQQRDRRAGLLSEVSR